MLRRETTDTEGMVDELPLYEVQGTIHLLRYKRSKSTTFIRLGNIWNLVITGIYCIYHIRIYMKIKSSGNVSIHTKGPMLFL